MNVLMPTTLEEACAMAARPCELPLIPMAGATDLLVHWPLRQLEHDKTYLDLSGIASLRAFSWSAESLTLGALTTYWDILRDTTAAKEFPLLIEAARQVGAVQIQSRGTWAGNIANGSPAADGVPVLMALDAQVVLTSTSGSRSVALSDYYTGYRASVRKREELISKIIIPRRRHDFTAFHKVGPRRAQAITKVGVAIAHQHGAHSEGWRIVANSVAPTVRRCRAVEAMLNTAEPVKSAADFLHALSTDISPIDDIRSTADYRRTVLSRLLYHTLRGSGLCPWIK